MNFIIPESTAAPAPQQEEGIRSVFVEEFQRKVIPRDAKKHWPQRHPITCALHHFPEGYPFKCVELGVYEGDHSYEMLSVLEPAELYLVDMWADIKISKEGVDYKEFDQSAWDKHYFDVVARYAKYGSVRILRMSTQSAAVIVPNDLDLVYIDANHEYAAVLKDINDWFPKIRQGGILSGDDYCREDVIKAVADFLKGYPQYKLQISDNSTQWWFVKGDY